LFVDCLCADADTMDIPSAATSAKEVYVIFEKRNDMAVPPVSFENPNVHRKRHFSALHITQTGYIRD